MRSLDSRFVVLGLVLFALTVVPVNDASAQCATCPAPAIAYQPVSAYRPVVAQPVVAYKPYTGWYLGRWFDRQQARREASKAAYAAAYSAAYAPTYTAAYAPTYTAAYRPYVTAYAPLSRPAAAPCSSCAETSYYPVIQTVARPVVMQPVMADPCCNTCTSTASCGCDACSTGVAQAAYTEPACSSCAGGSVSNVVPGGSYGSSSIGQQTPAPTLSPVPAENNSRYESNRPAESREATPADVVPAPVQDPDPGPASATEGDSSTYYNAPRLLDPRDRTARSTRSRQPTVDVWNAVYRRSATDRPISQTSSRPAPGQAEPRTQAEIDADGWSAVSRNR